MTNWQIDKWVWLLFRWFVSPQMHTDFWMHGYKDICKNIAMICPLPTRSVFIRVYLWLFTLSSCWLIHDRWPQINTDEHRSAWKGFGFGRGDHPPFVILRAVMFAKSGSAPALGAKQRGDACLTLPDEEGCDLFCHMHDKKQRNDKWRVARNRSHTHN